MRAKSRPQATIVSWRSNAYLTALWLGLSLAVILSFTVLAPNDPTDFVPFYCAGRILAENRDPYRAAPLRECERKYAPSDFGGKLAPIIPAPLPPYAIAMYRVIATLPYDIAAIVWRFAIAACCVISILLLQRLTRLPLSVTVAVIAPLALRDTLPLGQPVPIVVAILCGAALALNRGHDKAAGVLTALTMLEPHIGLPACLAVFAFRPQTRASMVAVGATAATVSWLSLPQSIEYVTRVLPAQALSEATWFQQYGTTHVLVWFGVSSTVALRIGEAWYVVTILAGIVLARQVAKRYCVPATYALVPPAVCMLGGPYLHIWHVGAALPAALLVASRSVGRGRNLAVLMMLALAIPWIEIGFAFTAILATLCALTLSVLYGRWKAPAVGALVFAMSAAGWFANGVQPRMRPLTTPLHYSADALAQVPWAQYVIAANPSSAGMKLSMFLKAPTWLGLVLLLVMLVCASGGPRSHCRS